jgi:hypothetical protein
VEHTNWLRAIWMQFNGFAAQPVRITIPSAANSAMRIKPESPSCARIALSPTASDKQEMRHEETRENLRVSRASGALT